MSKAFGFDCNVRRTGLGCRVERAGSDCFN